MTTIICRGFPVEDNGSREAIFGIDFRFFNVNSAFRGMRDVPAGFHVMHYASDADSIKHGICFYASSDVPVMVLEYKGEIEGLVMTLGGSQDANIGVFMGSYMKDLVNEDDRDNWSCIFTRHITEKLLNKVAVQLQTAPGSTTVGWKVSTVMSSNEENKLLVEEYNKHRQMHQHAAGSSRPLTSMIDEWEPRFNFVEIEAKHTYRPNATDQEKTFDCLDKSWYVQNTLLDAYGSVNAMLGEFELAYILVTVFGNYAAARQYNKLLLVLSSSETFVIQHNFFMQFFLQEAGICTFLDMWLLQMQTIPKEYIVEGLISVHIIVNALRNFKEYVSIWQAAPHIVLHNNKTILQIEHVLLDVSDLAHEEEMDIT